jgi:SAM-dependent methyltransferase
MGLRIDLGCGDCKKEGTVGIDIRAAAGVDHVLDLTTAPLPFPDGSVEYVYSSHFLEHVRDPTSIFGEVGRVASDGARLEFWTPYAWENSATIIDHKLFFNEDHYLHMCVWFVDFWKQILKSRWHLREIVYVVEPRILVDLERSGLASLDFAIRYWKGIVKEFGVFIEVSKTGRTAEDQTREEVRRSFATSRNGERHPLSPIVHPAEPPSDAELNRAISALLRNR